MIGGMSTHIQKSLHILGVICLYFFYSCVSSYALQVAVATNFQTTLKKMIPHFEQKHLVSIQTSSGSSGKLFAQIRYGAPHDLFLSADQKRPQLLEQEGLTLSRATYARGQLVLWKKQADDFLPLEQFQENKLPYLALANPKLAPYGEASMAVLEKLKLTSQVQVQMILTENVSQVLHLILHGNVDFGFTSASLIPKSWKQEQNKIWYPPASWYPPIQQQMVILKRTKRPQEARLFFEFLQSEEMQKMMIAHGYLPMQ